jgi:hypothetical protein
VVSPTIGTDRRPIPKPRWPSGPAIPVPIVTVAKRPMIADMTGGAPFAEAKCFCSRRPSTDLIEG